MSREIIYRLIGFFLAGESPLCKYSENRLEMGTKTISPQFKPLITTIANICKYCFTDKWNEENEIEGINPPNYCQGKV